MSELAASQTADPDTLPQDRRVRRLAVAAMANRGIAGRRERDLAEYLGDEAGYLITDYVAAATSEVAAQLLLTEHLLESGWEWPEILRSVWYREEALREAANRAAGCFDQ
jgi:hypothetical protein